MLCINGIGMNFSPELLNLIRQNKNQEFLKAAENFQFQSHVTISRVVDYVKATLLHYAAESGNGFIVDYLIKSNSQIDAQDTFGRTPLMLAVMNKHESAVEVLLTAKAKIHLVDVHHKTPLQMIFELEPTSALPLISMFLQHVPLRYILKCMTPELLAKNLREAGFTLKQAVTLKKPKVVKLLLDKSGCLVDERDEKTGDTALHIAVKTAKLRIAKMLVDRGADVDALDSVKATPMYYLYNSNEKAHDVILELLKVMLSRAKSPLTTSTVAGKFNDHPRMQVHRVLVHGCKEALQLVLQSIDNLNVSDKLGNTPVHYIAQNGNADVVETLRDRDFNVNKRNVDGYTPLHMAAFAVSPSALKFLLENKADVDARGHLYETPLSSLLQKLRSDQENSEAKKCVELLLEYGSDVEDYDVLGHFDWIAKAYVENEANGISSLVELLLRHLAINLSISGNVMDEYTMENIELQPAWIKFFDDTCDREVERMKSTKIHGNVTLFDFLTDSLRRISAHARNEEFIDEFRKFVVQLESNSPYSMLLKKRMVRAMRYAKLREQAVLAVCWLKDREGSALRPVSEYVVDYLDSEEMKNLCAACTEKKRL